VLDMVRLKNNGYSASELLCFDKSRLGDYKDVGVHIRTGKFGAYIEHGDAKFNLGKCLNP
jgi:topoisomerase IA-like protein